MASLLDTDRPPVFCPGCSHERILFALDRAFQLLGLLTHEVVIVTDIGCSGLFDTFFKTHAFHGLHGRALTYAAGIKLARPELHVVVVMGDGGLGIGGAHFLAACRRNLDMTLLILNNFNFGMTGGQFSCTTPTGATTSSGFLNNLERPLDICSVAAAAGAPFVVRVAASEKKLDVRIVDALAFRGFSVVDIWSICTGRYLKRNPRVAKDLERRIEGMEPFDGPISANLRREYGEMYREALDRETQKTAAPGEMHVYFTPSIKTRREVVLLGSAGGQIISAGSLLARAAILGGMQVTQKNDYDVTVMRGPAVSELIISNEPILYPGVNKPDVLIALSKEGVKRRQALFYQTGETSLIIREPGVPVPNTAARVQTVDFHSFGIRKNKWALASLVILARRGDPVTLEMLKFAVEQTFDEKGRREFYGIMELTERFSDNLAVLKP